MQETINDVAFCLVLLSIPTSIFFIVKIAFLYENLLVRLLIILLGLCSYCLAMFLAFLSVFMRVGKNNTTYIEDLITHTSLILPIIVVIVIYFLIKRRLHNKIFYRTR